MFGNQVPDKDLQKLVNRTLERTGVGSQAKIMARVNAGTVIVSGTIKYENQRRPILKAIQGVAGVQRVSDTMACAPKAARTDA
ncbi:BON domain-containing protein [Bremerella cremea]|uniref:BON domain-containing protein n=1 Tax=Bremerella cremea TaxID=1031537 RepID=A0A368KJI2_9BACT|nr:BON domain-containing protein [Bremerella cremea]RCS40712.1 BON domain-containing protein [Bremerella cremea]